MDIVRSSLFVDSPGLSPSGLQRLKVKGGEPLLEWRSGVINRGLEALISVYRLALPLFIGVALAACIMLLCISGFSRRVEPLFLVAGVSAGIAASGILMLAYIEAAAIPEMGMNAETNTFRLSPAYPALLLFGAAAILAGSYQSNDRVKAWLARCEMKHRKISS